MVIHIAIIQYIVEAYVNTIVLHVAIIQYIVEAYVNTIVIHIAIIQYIVEAYVHTIVIHMAISNTVQFSIAYELHADMTDSYLSKYNLWVKIVKVSLLIT